MAEIEHMADRMAFLGALVISETEAAMKLEKTLPGGEYRKRYKVLEKFHRQSFDIFNCYDRNLKRAEIYDKAAKCIDAINVVLDGDEEAVEVLDYEPPKKPAKRSEQYFTEGDTRKDGRARR